MSKALSISVCLMIPFALAACFFRADEEYRPSKRALELNNRAVRAFDKEDYELALKLINQAISMAPKFDKAYASKAAILGRLGRNAEALQAIETAVKLMPKFAEAYVPLGLFLERAGKAEEAPQAYRKAIDLCDAAIREDPRDSKAIVNRAVANYLLGERRAALTALKELLDKHPSNDLAESVRAMILADDRGAFVQGTLGLRAPD